MAVNTGMVERQRKNRLQKESVFQKMIEACAIFAALLILSIIVFVGKQGLLTFKTVSPETFFLNKNWFPNQHEFGALSFIIGSISLTFLSLVFSVPFAISAAICMAEIAPNWVREIMRPATDLFVGIPSVVYGMIGITTLAPWIGKHFGGTGYGLLVASIIVAIMVLPTILSVTEDTLRSLPSSLKEASYALGATRWQTIRNVLLPAAKHGILTAIILGIGRAMGETMAVQMVIGNSPTIVSSLIKPTSALTSEIALEMPNTEYGTTWNNALFLMALVLLVISLCLIILIHVISKRKAI